MNKSFIQKLYDIDDKSFKEFILKNKNLKSFFFDKKYDYSVKRSNCITIIDKFKLNENNYLNKHLECINNKIKKGDILIGRSDIFQENKKINIFNFIFHRVFPKIKFLNKIYYLLFKDQIRVLSRYEVIGRLISCGYKIIELKNFKNKIYFKVIKSKKPDFNFNPSFGPIITLNRVGYKGKIIKVYKFRTMYPYSEYIQKWISDNYGLEKGGKFSNDPRVTPWGKILRKYWLDELPMFINLFKGDIKLIGVRPLSEHYLSLYPKKLKLLRKKIKPGLLPPFYADLPKTLEEIVSSELNYIEKYLISPYKTDLIYFKKILFNILIKKSRSK